MQGAWMEYLLRTATIIIAQAKYGVVHFSRTEYS